MSLSTSSQTAGERPKFEIAAAAVAVSCRAQRARVVELLDARWLAQQRAAALLGHAQPALAQVVAAALDERRQNCSGMTCCRNGMSLRMSCSCRLMVCVEMTTRHSLSAHGARMAGHQIGEALADAGARLDHEMLARRAMALATASAMSSCCGRAS